MNAETITPEVVSDESAQLVAIVQQNALPAPVAQSLQTSFAPLFTEAHKILTQSRGITVTDASQKLEIKLARECRLALRAVRVDGDKVRKQLKEQSLREGKAIDGFQAILLQLTATEEERLDSQEKFAERQEAARKDALRTERTKIAVELGIDPALYLLGEMSAETFDQLVSGTRLARAQAAERAKKDEADRIAKETADLAEREAAEERDRQKRLHAEELDRQRVAAQREQERIEAVNAAKFAAEKKRAEVERQKTEAARAAAESEAHRQRCAREQLEQAAKEAQAKEAARVANRLRVPTRTS